MRTKDRLLALSLIALGSAMLSSSACGDEDGSGGAAQAAAGAGGSGTHECGDGTVDDDEECDDGNLDDADDCLSTCVIARCGDLVVEEGVEECDDGNLDDADDCLTECVFASCGDGFVQTGVEECDDGNDEDGDACTSSCTPGAGCGNGNVDAGEDCDDGNTKNSDDCLSTCVAASCGDGYAQIGVEECDDGNGVDDDACTNACTIGQNVNYGCPGTDVAVPADMEVDIGGDTSASTDAYSGSCGGDGAPDIVYAVTPDVDGTLTVSVAGLTQDSDPVIYVRTGSCDGGAESGCADNSFGGGVETLVLQVTGGVTYWVFIDGYDTTAGPFSLALQLSTQVAGDDCPGNPVSINMGETKTVSGNTAAAQADRKGPPPCDSASTKDIVYAVTPNATGKLVVSMDPVYDGSVYARAGSCTSTQQQLACSEQGGGPGQIEGFVINVTAGTKYWVFADGKNGSAGMYSMDFQLLPP